MKLSKSDWALIVMGMAYFVAVLALAYVAAHFIQKFW